MKKKDFDFFKKLLLEEKDKIKRHLSSISESSEQDMGESFSGDAADIASLEINQNSLHKIGKRESYLLAKIELALKKIEDKTYGECENCGEDIAIERLKARPVAQLCIDCKEEQESVERRYSDKEEDKTGEIIDELQDN